jgi:hypothetical protein
MYMYIIVTDIEGNIMIYRLPKSRGRTSGNDIISTGPYHDHTGQSVYLILRPISVTIVFIALKTII